MGSMIHVYFIVLKLTWRIIPKNFLKIFFRLCIFVLLYIVSVDICKPKFLGILAVRTIRLLYGENKILLDYLPFCLFGIHVSYHTIRC